MSIYFVHFFLLLLPISFLGAVFLDSYESSAKLQKKIAPKNLITCIIVGAVFAYIAHFIATKNLQDDTLIFITNIMLLIAFFALIALYFTARIAPKIADIPLLKESIFAFIVLGFFVRYLKESVDFKLFGEEVLDTLAINSFALTLLALCVCVTVFYLLKILQRFSPKFTLIIAFATAILSINPVIADILLYLVRQNILPSGESLISYIGKSLYYAFLNPYIFMGFLLILGIISLTKIPRNIHKNALFDLDYRKKLGLKNFINQKFALNICVCAVSVGILLYYDLYASKPVVIDKPTILEQPQSGVFEFSAEILNDNKLHRFAYINDEGKEIRFFLLNKFEDRSSPAVAFDACALCGDMGYIKKGGELICIACNVRIFLPSVGKFGGCNPIPLEFSNENGVIRIKLESVLGGANYFSKIVSKEVIDPVNGAKLLNTDALFRYEFNGRTYFFKSQENYDAFVKEPEKYVSGDVSALYIIQKYHKES